jgi:hypothetical protein
MSTTTARESLGACSAFIDAQARPGRRPSYYAMAKALGIRDDGVLRWIADGVLTGNESIEELTERCEELHAFRAQTRRQRRSFRVTVAQRKDEARERIAEQVAAGELVVRQLTPEDVKRLEQARARRDREAA